MKLKVVRVYQPIEFQSKLETYFVSKPAMKNVEMELRKDAIVSIRTDKDYVLVPLTNVAFMVPETAETEKKDYTRERKAGV